MSLKNYNAQCMIGHCTTQCGGLRVQFNAKLALLCHMLPCMAVRRKTFGGRFPLPDLLTVENSVRKTLNKRLLPNRTSKNKLQYLPKNLFYFRLWKHWCAIENKAKNNNGISFALGKIMRPVNGSFPCHLFRSKLWHTSCMLTSSCKTSKKVG